ncbi:MAG: O-antigen ligase family protein, partial [Actinobacteria bacterium]|nr:O-antigen ligase family protein [Actinomycetota bacterium]
MTTLVRIPFSVAPAALVLAGTATLALLSVPPQQGAAAAAVATVLVAAAVWALVDLQRFVLIAVLGAMVLPTALVQPAGAQVAAADVLLVLALGAWLVRCAAQAAPAPWTRGNRMFGPSVLFLAVTAASLAWSVAPGDTVKAIVQIAQIVIVIPLVFATLPRSIGAVRQGLLVFVGVTSVLALVTIAYFAPRLAAGDLTAQYLPGLHKNAIGSFLGAGLVLAYAFWLRERRPGVRRALGVTALVELAGMFAAASRGALAGAFLGIVAVSLLLRRRRLLSVGVAAVAAAAFVVAIDTGPTPEQLAAGGYETAIVRGYSFDNAVAKIAARPLLGTGAGTYFDQIPELGIGLADPNNMFLLTAAELGI